MIETWKEYAIVNDALEKLVEKSNTIAKVKKALKHIIKAGGKRTRPIIVLLSGKLCGGQYEDVLNMALAVELIHTASLAHDDVIDKGVVRRNVKALHIEYDLSLAILVGDWLISKSVELTSKYGEEVIKEFADVGMLMSEGEVLDVYSVKEKFDEEDYFKCIASKTASLFAYSAKNACKIVSEDKKAAKKLYEYGLNLGIAYQLVDDLLEYLEMYEDKKSEFESKTLPIIYEEKIGFERAVIKTLELIKSYAKKSVDALNYFKNNEYKLKLLKMVEFMTSDLLKGYVSRNKEILKLLERYG
ncbi:MAG: polyprenyl synthetase family protein [Archaeoglobaceae archaeon]|nr:polyprenyl synthetase family protein [Archaeoglobaceae archaeon]HDD36432.1 polyprenyl synthetase family protein [Archaeoglobus veneficus]